MLSSTISIIKAALAADPTINPPDADAALAILAGKAQNPDRIGRVIRTTEAARILGVSTKSLRSYSSAGALVPVYAPGAVRKRTGYTEASVRACAEGRASRRAIPAGKEVANV